MLYRRAFTRLVVATFLRVASPVEFGYWNADLERVNDRGRTQMFLARLQWIHSREAQCHPAHRGFRQGPMSHRLSSRRRSSG